MRIVIFGAGGLGGYFGARLGASGHDVALIARGAHLDALHDSGLTMVGPTETVRLPQIVATDDPARIGAADLVLLAVKTWQLPAALTAMAPLVGDDTVVVTLQNGVEAPDQVAEVYGRDTVLPGVARVFAMVEEPGVVRYVGGPGSLMLAEWDDADTSRVERIRSLLRDAGIPSPVPRNILGELWSKFVFITGVGGLGAVTNAPFGVLRGRPGMRRQLAEAMSEIAQVARAKGVDLPDDVVPATMKFLDVQPEDGTSSLQRDIAAGRPSELDAWTGAVVRLGASSGTPTPVNAVLYEILSLRAS